ncbi:Nudix family hydrolase [Neptuniibacter sp. SY11_33]|uniref:Nudix family hydrolase n=1 Tax=Neptuniibacter sp. SY11_33 TaxID=3398215 RepID=UPI0039F5448D
MANKVVHVAAAAIWNSKRELLIAKRPDDKHQGGLWEFPGGKVETGEAVLDALSRELDEELGIRLTQAEKLIEVPYHYPDKSVLLDVYSITGFEGEPWGKEGQPVRWVKLNDLEKYEFPAANKPILNACLLPKTLAITPYLSDVQQLEASIVQAIRCGAEGVVLRAPLFEAGTVASDKIIDFINAQIDFAAVRNVFFAVNTTVEVANKLAFEAVHLSGSNLDKLSHRDEFAGRWLGASCHNAEELSEAIVKGVDYVMLSPVQHTQSHPEVEPLGWKVFAELAKSSVVPVFALGGMERSDLALSVENGAQGIAAISAWSEG